MLVLRALGLGDLLAAVPALRALRQWVDATHPGAELVLACPRAFEPLLGLGAAAGGHRVGGPGARATRRPLVDRVLDLEAKDAARLQTLPTLWHEAYAEPPLVAVNLHGIGPASHRALLALDPGRLVAFGCEEAGVGGPPGRRTEPAEEHERARWCRLLREDLGVAADPSELRLDPPAEEPAERGVVVVHPGAAYRSRRWPADRWASVAQHLRAGGHRVVLTGSSDEVPLAEQVAAMGGVPLDTVRAGRTDLGQLAGLVAAARLVLSGDTGVAHLASAYRTPSVVLLGPTSPAWWGPPEDGPHTVLWHGTGARVGDPHGTEVDPALLQVTVAEVVAAVRDRLRPS